MIPIFRTKFTDFDNKAEVFQETCSATEHVQRFLEGDHVMEEPLGSSKDFASGDDVDFNADLPSSHHDIFDVASGQDPVFKETIETAPLTPEPESASTLETNIGE